MPSSSSTSYVEYRRADAALEGGPLGPEQWASSLKRYEWRSLNRSLRRSTLATSFESRNRESLLISSRATAKNSKVQINFYLRKTCGECRHVTELQVGKFELLADGFSIHWQFVFQRYENIIETARDWRNHIAEQMTNGWQIVDEEGKKYSLSAFWTLVESG